MNPCQVKHLAIFSKHQIQGSHNSECEGNSFVTCQAIHFCNLLLHSKGIHMMKAAGSFKNWYPSIKLYGVFPEC